MPDPRIDLMAPGTKSLEFVVAPSPTEEIPGLRRFFQMSMHTDPENVEVGAAAFNLKDILKRFLEVARDPAKRAVYDEIRILESTDGVFDQITLLDVDPSLDSSQNLRHVTNTFDQTQGMEGASDILRVIVDEIRGPENHASPSQEREARNTLEDIVFGQTSDTQRAQMLARALGIPVESLPGTSREALLDYLAGLVESVEEIEDLVRAEAVYRLKGNVSEVQMLEHVEQQTGVECVLYATRNLADSARHNGALTSDVTIAEMQQRIPTGPGNYRVMSTEWIDFLREKGFGVQGNFNWGQALEMLTRGEGGLVLRLGADHAVSVVGIRPAPGSGNHVEFCVANSLHGYWPSPSQPGEVVWVDARTLISKTVMRQRGSDQRIDNYLITWHKDEIIDQIHIV